MCWVLPQFIPSLCANYIINRLREIWVCCNSGLAFKQPSLKVHLVMISTGKVFTDKNTDTSLL